MWKIEGDHSTLKTLDGKLPPLNKAAKAVYDAHVKARKAGDPSFDTIQTCKPHGFRGCCSPTIRSRSCRSPSR